MTTTITRKINFSAGPAVMPVEVLEEARENMLSLGTSGLGIMEISHRGPMFEGILDRAVADLKELLGLGDDHAVLFLTGGASQQFFQVPMNFLQGGTANYIDTGEWSSKAIKEAQRFGTVQVAASSKADKYTYIPTAGTYAPGARFTHYTSNNTIYGTQFVAEPASPDLLICDASSDILSRPVDVKRHAMIYAGAQKNLGPSGVTVVIVRNDFAETGTKEIPQLLQYRTQIANNSLYNTPPTFPIYLVGLVLQWLKRQGGLAAMAKRNEAKAGELYATLDGSAFWDAPVRKDSRSLMNVVFRLKSEELDKKFLKEAEAASLSGLKGHRSVGGMRASIYNALEPSEVSALCQFMKDFERRNG